MRWYAGLSLIVGGLLVVWLSARSESAAARPVVKLASAQQVPAGVRTELAHYTGAGSCMAAACHGFQVPTAGMDWKSSGTIWLTKDKHSEAYNVLFNEQSKKIVQALYPEKDPKHIQPQFEARCVGCHAGVDTNEPRKVAHLLTDGVSCEACHGPAKNWIARHTESGWDRAHANGEMVNTRDLKVRAEQCVKCHVGAPAVGEEPARDMNHDMIAAGHPALKFEFAAYLANMPAHWKRKTASGDPPGLPRDLDLPDVEARAWAIGQFVTGKQALELLAYRAETANSPDKNHSSPWPEFSEYDCFACHHDLQKDSFRRKENRRPAAELGNYVWGNWYFPMCEVLEPKSAAALTDLQSKVSQPFPKPDEIVPLARAAANLFGEFAQRAAQEANYKAKAPSLFADAKQRQFQSWSEAVQSYLALAALSAQQGSASGDPLAALRKSLAFPPGDTKSQRLSSPRSFEPATITAEMEKLKSN